MCSLKRVLSFSCRDGAGMDPTMEYVKVRLYMLHLSICACGVLNGKKPVAMHEVMNDGMAGEGCRRERS